MGISGRHQLGQIRNPVAFSWAISGHFIKTFILDSEAMSSQRLASVTTSLCLFLFLKVEQCNLFIVCQVQHITLLTPETLSIDVRPWPCLLFAHIYTKHSRSQTVYPHCVGKLYVSRTWIVLPWYKFKLYIVLRLFSPLSVASKS